MKSDAEPKAATPTRHEPRATDPGEASKCPGQPPIQRPPGGVFAFADRVAAWRWWGLCGVLLVMCWALYVRLYKLDTFLPGLYKDEADTGNEALYFFVPRPISHWFTIGTWGGVQRFQWLLTAQFLKLTSPTAYNLRLFNVLLTVAGLPVVYLIARRMRMKRFASLVSVFLLATIPWTLVESRMGWPNPIVLLTVPGAVLLALQAMHSRRWYWWVSLAVWTDFMLWGFVGAQPVFVAIVLWGLWLMVTAGLIPLISGQLRSKGLVTASSVPAMPADDSDIACGGWRFRWTILPKAALALVVTLVGMLPWLPYYREHPEQINLRARQTFIYYPGLDVSPASCQPGWQAAHRLRYPEAFCKWMAANPGKETDPWTVIRTNTVIALGMFTVRGDDDAVFNIRSQPQLSHLVGILFLLSLSWILLRGLGTLLLPWLRRFRRPTDSLLLLWMGSFLFFTEIVTMPTPKAQHGLPLVPALCLLIGRAVDDGYNGLAWLRRRIERLQPTIGLRRSGRILIPAACAATSVVMVVVARQSWHWYFVDYDSNRDTYSQFNPRSYEIGRFAATLPGPAPVVLAYAPEPYVGEVASFAQGKGRLVLVMWMQDGKPTAKPPDQIPTNPSGLVFTGDERVLQPYVDQWRQRYPHLVLVDHRDRYGQLMFKSAALTPGP